MNLYINTFGAFELKAENKSILKASGRTYKLYKLFQFFMTFRNKKLLPETIIDNLWSDSNSGDPKNVLRTQIFRLRQIIKSLLTEDMDEKDYVSVNFVNGYYCLEFGDCVIIDLDEFECFINKGDLAYSSNPDDAVMFYENAIKLYKGIYLAENSYEVWLMPTRNYYHRLFLKTLYKLIDLLKEKEYNDRIISLCEKALIIEPYEETIHIRLMEAMLKTGQYKGALNHFDYSVQMLEKETGAKPSKDFIEFEKKIHNFLSYKSEMDIFNIHNNLTDNTIDGAFQCELEYFKFLFNIQKRKALRTGENDYLGIITLINNKSKYDKSNEFSRFSSALTQILEKMLRRGDVFTFWNDNQILIMLHNVKNDGIINVENRIKKGISNCYDVNSFHITMNFQPLSSEHISF